MISLIDGNIIMYWGASRRIIMTYTTFCEWASEVSVDAAIQMAVWNRVTLAQAQIWASTYKGITK